MTETESKEEKLQRRKRELEEELDRYAQAGVASPNLLKATRWVSRFLYLGMAALVVYLLFSGWGKVSKQDFETVRLRSEQYKQKFEQSQRQHHEALKQLAEAAVEHARLRQELRRAENPAAEADRAFGFARRLVKRFDLPPADLAEAYREAAPEQRLEWIAMLAAAAGDDHAALMKEVAISAQRSEAERIMAVRWFAERRHTGAREVLAALARGTGPVAKEAAEALEKIGKGE